MLALYTDGLIETRDRDVDERRALACEALARSSDSLDETCDRVLQSLLPPGGASDDVALLLARTQGLPPPRSRPGTFPPTRRSSARSASRSSSSWRRGP